MADDAERIDELAGTIQPMPDTSDDTGDDLSSIIDRAIDGEPDTTEAAPTEGRARDEHGRFVAKEQAADEPAEEESADAAPDTEPSAEASVSAEQQQDATPATEWTDGHFRGFSDEDRSAFLGLPKEAQDVSMKLIQGRDQYWTEQVKEYDNYVQQLSPLVQSINQHYDRMDGRPAEYISAVLAADQVLQSGTYAEKLNVVRQLADIAGVPVQIPEPDPYADPTQPGGEAYAAIHDAQVQRQILERQNQQYQAQLQQMQVAQAEQMWASFQRERNADGSPKFPDAEMYRQEIGQMLAQGHANTLAEAYDRVSQRYDALIARRVEEKTRHLTQAQQQAVAKARRAAPVRATGSQTSGQTQQTDLSSLINANLDAHGLQ